MVEKLEEEKGVDFPWTLADLSDDDITLICDDLEGLVT